MSESLNNLVTDLVDAWNTHDCDRVTAFYSPDYEGVDVSEAAPRRGRQGVRQALERFLRAFPDLYFTKEQAGIQDDQAALCWTARGTHLGTMMNIPATGRTIAVRGVSLLTLENQMITRGLHVWDVAGLLRAIGLLPEL